MSTSNSKIFSKTNIARAKSKAIENRAAADGQSAIIGAWGGASASRNPLVPWKGDGGILRICITDALLATSKMLYYCNVCSKKCVKEEIKI